MANLTRPQLFGTITGQIERDRSKPFRIVRLLVLQRVATHISPIFEIQTGSRLVEETEAHVLIGLLLLLFLLLGLLLSSRGSSTASGRSSSGTGAAGGNGGELGGTLSDKL